MTNINTDCDVLIVGCGFSGAVTARYLAQKGMRALILEKRGHIAGNMYDYIEKNGVLTHRYGPHIFHTKDKNAFEFLKNFSDFFPYEHRVLGRIDGKYVPIPFNFKSIDELFDSQKAEKIKTALKETFKDRPRVTVSELLEKTGVVKEIGEFVYEKVFIHYTAKQWGMPPEKVDKSVINRVPVVLGYDDRYFSDPIQCMPSQGYTKLFENMLRHENITVELNIDAQDYLKANPEQGVIEVCGKPFTKPVVWTAPADELFGNIYGRLPYRSLDLKIESHDKTYFQPASVVNYPNEEDFTRITEFKYLTGQKIDGTTTIMKEYPMQYNSSAEKGNIPYYPIINPDNLKLYDRYASLADKIKNLYLCGRLGKYKYCNMDGAVADALSLAEKIYDEI